MPNIVEIKRKIGKFNKTITVPGDKSLSIRWVLFASLANGKSKAQNLLLSEDVLAAIEAIKKLGIKVNIKKKNVQFLVKELMDTNTKKISQSMQKIQVR